MSSPHRPLDPRSGLVLDTHELGRRAGAMKVVRATVEAPADLGVAVIGVPPGSPVELDLRLESVVEGVLVSGTATVEVQVDIQELFVYPGAEPDNDLASRLQGDLIDLEPLLRDEVVLDLPFQPLCRDDCLGLCVECGANVNKDPDHRHETDIDPRWEALRGIEGDGGKSYDVLEPAPQATKFPGKSARRNQE
jgi:uncharacterized protein